MLTLNTASLNWAVAHAVRYGDTDVFPLPFEYEAIRHDWSNLRDHVAAQNILEWQVRPHRTLLAPKAVFKKHRVGQRAQVFPIT